MSHYIHHVPGRLRLKTPCLRRNEAEARRARQWLESMEGVLASEVNTLTGSVIIKYDTEAVSAQALLNGLRGRGYLTGETGLPNSEIVVGGKTVAHKITDTFVSKVVETVVERSAVALIAAVL
jgi:hypothetical protein